MAEKTDEVLMDEVAHGDLTGLETLIGRYKHKMLHYLSRTVEDAVLAEDLFQEVFLLRILEEPWQQQQFM